MNNNFRPDHAILRSLFPDDDIVEEEQVACFCYLPCDTHPPVEDVLYWSRKQIVTVFVKYIFVILWK